MTRYNNLDMRGTLRVLNLPAPVDGSEPARLTDLQVATVGIDSKPSVRAASTENVPVASAPATIDGVTLASGDRLLLKNQTDATENGLYAFNGGGVALTRTADVLTASSFVFVEEGADNRDTQWMIVTDGPITLGVTAITWTQFGAPGSLTADGQGVEVTGGVISLELDGATLAKSAAGLRVDNVPVTAGGTGATTAAQARSNLGAPGVYRAALGALAAGTPITVTHNLGLPTGWECTVNVWDTSASERVEGVKVNYLDGNRLTVTVDVAAASGVLAIVVVG